MGVPAVVPGGFDWSVAASTFPTDPATLAADAAIIVSGLVYAAGVLRLRRRGRRWSPAAATAFAAGLLALFVAVGSGLTLYDDTDFSTHVVQHLLLMWVAPLCFALSRPVTLAAQASPRRAQVLVVRAARSRAAALATGWPAWAAAYLSMPVDFFTPLYGMSATDQTVHAAVHLWFLGTGVLFWQGLLGLDPIRHRRSHLWRIGGLVATMPLDTAVGVVLMVTPVPLVDGTGLAATHAGGQLFWMGTMIASGIGLAGLLWQWAREDERRVAFHERRAAVPAVPVTLAPRAASPDSAVLADPAGR